MLNSLIVYLTIGLLFSLKAAALSWRTIWQGDVGNIPFWLFLWPWPFAAELYKKATGKYPSWTPDR